MLYGASEKAKRIRQEPLLEGPQKKTCSANNERSCARSRPIIFQVLTSVMQGLNRLYLNINYNFNRCMAGAQFMKTYRAIAAYVLNLGRVCNKMNIMYRVKAAYLSTYKFHLVFYILRFLCKHRKNVRMLPMLLRLHRERCSLYLIRKM